MKRYLAVAVFVIVAAILIALPLSAAASTSGIKVAAASTEGAQSAQATSGPAAELNEYEGAVAAMINAYRTESGLNAIAYEPTLTYVAKLRSQDLMDRNYFSHYTPEGTTVFNLFRSNGVSYSIGGENLGQAIPAGIGTPEAFMNAWKNSPTHNANMLRQGYNYIGVGMVESSDRIVVTTVFTN